MQKITSSADLKEAIIQLENRQAAEGKVMKAHFQLAYESVKPINLIKSTFREVVESQDLSDNIVSTAAGLTAGYLSKTLFIGESKDPLRRLLGTVLMYSVTNLVAKHPDVIKSVGGKILNLIRSMPWDAMHDSEKNWAEETSFRN